MYVVQQLAHMDLPLKAYKLLPRKAIDQLNVVCYCFVD